MNILEAYFKQKEKEYLKKILEKEREKICLNCLHSSVYDSEIEQKIIERRVYCRKWKTVVRVGQAKACHHFEQYNSKA
jgi:lipopolysaccharide biosynthesis glycosyltransferase